MTPLSYTGKQYGTVLCEHYLPACLPHSDMSGLARSAPLCHCYSCVLSCRYGSVLITARLGTKVEIITTATAGLPHAMMPPPMLSQDFTVITSQPQEQTPVTSWEVSGNRSQHCNA